MKKQNKSVSKANKKKVKKKNREELVGIDDSDRESEGTNW